MNDNLGASNKVIHEAGLTVQSLGENPKMDAVLTENLSAGKANKKWKKRMKREEKKATNKDEVPSIDQSKIEGKVQSMGQTVRDTGPTENSAEVHVSRNRKKKRKREEKINVEIQRKVETGLTENLAEGNVTIEKPKSREDAESIGQTNIDIGSTENLDEGNVTRQRKKKQKSKAKIDIEVQRKLDTKSLENLEGNVTIEKPKNREDVQSIGQTNMVIRLTENLAGESVIIKNPKIQDDVQPKDQSEMDNGPTESSAEVLVTRKRKKKRKSQAINNVEVQSEVNTGSTENLAEGSVKLAEGNEMIIKNPKIQDDAQSTDQTEKRKRKKKQKSRVKIKDEAQSNISTRSTENLAQGNAVSEILKIKDEVQSTGMAKMDARLKENIADGNVTGKNLKIQDEIQNLNQTKMDMRPAEIFSEGNLTRKRKKKRNIKAKFEAEVHTEIVTKSTENLAQSMDQTRMETGPIENFAEGKTEKRKKKPKRKTQIKDEVQSVVDTKTTVKLTEGNVTIENQKIQDEAQSTDQTKMEAGPAENSAEGKTGKRKKKPKRKRQIKDEVQSVVDTRPTENLAVGNVTTKKPKINEEQSIGLAKVDAGSTGNLAEGNEAHSKDQTEMDTGPTENSAEGNVTRKRIRKRNRIKKAKTKDEVPREMDAGSAENLPEGNATIKLNGMLEGDCISNCEALAGPMEFEGKLSPSVKQEICHPCTSPITPIRRKLLVLDVNGLLADIVYSAPRDCRGDIRIFGRAVFKRPFCDDFLKFCFQNFDVGIWSSRSKKIIEPVVNYLLGDQKDKLLFCWDMDHATKTRFNTLENKHKPLVCKELSKIWGNDDCNLPWKKEDYDESNTLLLDDSPYKALLNPLHTAIFPSPYQYDNENDDSLGPGGNLRVYLEGLVTAENVQKYVEQHPFGQKSITKEHCSWQFYSRVLHQVSNPVQGQTSMPNSVEGQTSMPNSEEGKTSMPNSEEGKTSMPTSEEGITLMPTPEEGKTSMSNPEEGKPSLPRPEEGTTSMPSPKEDTPSLPSPEEGITSIPSPEVVTTSIPSPVEGTTSMPSLEEGTTLPSSLECKIPMPSPEEGKTSAPPVEGKSSMPKSMKGRDDKWVKARKTVPFKPKKEKAKATFLWPI